jgi:3-deoxy-7-phosphoheptulonate synthase
MPAERTSNVNVIAQDALIPPAEIKRCLPITPQTEASVLQSRATLQRIVDRQDHRLFVVVGPCSIRDLRAARDDAQRLRQRAAEVADTLFIVVRAYCEKPRTTVGGHHGTRHNYS